MDIKFRGWDGKKMVHNLIVSYDGSVAMWLNAEIADSKSEDWSVEGLMQFTGMVDRNSNNIYTGDILMYGNGYCVVEAVQSCFGTRVLSNSKFIPLYYWDTDMLEVVGNVYTNPGLMLQG